MHKLTSSYEDTLIVHHKLTKLKHSFIRAGTLIALTGLIVSVALALLEIKNAWAAFQLAFAVGLFLAAGSMGINWVSEEVLPE